MKLTASERQAKAWFDRLTLREMHQLIYGARGIRPNPTLTRPQLMALLWYKPVDTPHTHSPVDTTRAWIMEFIQAHKDKLSMPCDGDCRKHCDAVVLHCAIELHKDITVDIGDISG